MKLSDLHIGDVFRNNGETQSFLQYFVLISMETLLIGAPDITNVIFYLKSYYLNAVGSPNTISDNRPFEIVVPMADYKKDTFPTVYPLHKSNVELIPHEELPLLINLPNKTLWFERVLEKDIENYGQNIYALMKQGLKKRGIYETEI